MRAPQSEPLDKYTMAPRNCPVRAVRSRNLRIEAFLSLTMDRITPASRADLTRFLSTVNLL